MTEEATTTEPRAAVTARGKVIVLGLGNDILTDDAVGLCVAAEVRRRLTPGDGIEVIESMEMGLALLDLVSGFERLLLVDSIQTGEAPPGFLHEFQISDLPTVPLTAPHFLGIGELLELGRCLNIPVPKEARVFAIEVEDPFTIGGKMTAKVREAVPGIVERVVGVALGMLKVGGRPEAGGQVEG